MSVSWYARASAAASGLVGRIPNTTIFSMMWKDREAAVRIRGQEQPPLREAAMRKWYVVYHMVGPILRRAEPR